MSNKLIIVIVVVILVIGGYFFFKNRTVAPTEVEIDSNMPAGENNVEEAQVMEQLIITETGVVKEFTINSVPFSYSLSSMTVDKGDTVKITLKNVEGTHDLKIDEFNASTRILNAGQEQTITFVADKAGTFEYYCSVGNHRAMGMVGAITVR